MKTHRTTTLLTGLVALGTLGACSTTSQLSETYPGNSDPMYAQFRTPAPEAVALNRPVTADYNKGAYEFQDESLSSKTVNPDLVAQYQNDDQRVDEEQATDEYYVEEYNRPGAYGNQPQVVNNFYGNPNRFGAFGGSGFGAGFYDPFWGPGMGFHDPFWGPGMGFGSPWAQPWGRPGFNMSLGFGWGGGFGWNRWNRFGGFGGMYGMYDPFFDPWGPSMAYGGWGRPGWGRGFGAWGPGGFYGGPNVLIVDNREFTPTTRRVSQGRTSAATNTRLGRSSTAQDRSGIRRSGTSSGSRSITSSQNDAYRNNDNRRYSTSSGAAAYQRTQTRANQRGNSRYEGSSVSRSSQRPEYAPQRSNSRTYQRSNSSNGSYRSSDGNRSSRSYGSSNSGSSFGNSSSSSPSRSYSSGSSRSYSSGGATRSSSGGRSGSRRP